MHGQADQVIPFQHSQTLYEAAPEPKEFLWVKEAGHNDFTVAAGQRLHQALISFQDLIETRQ